jgi:hypothetical protein
MNGYRNASLGVVCQNFRSKTLGYEKPRDKIKENAPRKGVFLYRFVGIFGLLCETSFEDAGYGLISPSISGNNLTQITQITQILPFRRFWMAYAVRLHRDHPGVANA